MGQNVPIQAKVSPISLNPGVIQPAVVMTYMYMYISSCWCCFLGSSSRYTGCYIIPKKLHLCTERHVNQSLEGSFDVLHDRDNHDTPGDNKADTSATLLLDTSL